MSQYHKIDKVFKKHLANHEVTPPEKIWSAISSEVNSNKNRKALALWMPIAAGIAILIGLTAVLTINTSTITIADDNTITNSNSSNHTNRFSTPTHEPQKVKNEKAITTINKSDTPDNSSAIQEPHNEKRSQLAYISPIYSAIGSTIVPHSTNLHLSNKKKAHPQYIPIHTTNMEVDKLSKSSFAITALAGPTYSHRTTNSNASTNEINSMNESGLNSLSGGLNMKFKTRTRWSFESGIFYTQAGQNLIAQTTPNNYNYQSVIPNGLEKITSNITTYSNSLGTTSFHKPESQPEPTIPRAPIVGNKTEQTEIINENMELSQRLSYIEIPFAARYNIYNNKTVVSVSAGVCANFLIANEANLTLDNGQEFSGETQGIENISYSSKIGIGLEYPFLNNLSLNLEPIFRYFITPVNQSNNVQFRPYSLGVNAGISYSF